MWRVDAPTWIDSTVVTKIMIQHFSRGLLFATFAFGLRLAEAAPTVQDFDQDGIGTPFVPLQISTPPAPVVLSGGPLGSGRFLRLVSRGFLNSNTITFPVTEPTAAPVMVAEFDFRIAAGESRGDGFGFALLDAAAYPGTVTTVAPVLAPALEEEPNYTGSVGVGFDILANPAIGSVPADLAHHGIRQNFSTSVSLHFDGALITQADTTPVTDLANGAWLRARVTVRTGRVTVQLSATANDWVTLLDRAVPGLRPYAARAHFGGRCGGDSADVEIDNVSVNFLAEGESVVSLDTAVTEVGEEAGTHPLRLTRTGDLSGAASVGYSATAESATADADFTAVTGTVNFAARQASATIAIPILADALTENAETFTVTLASPAGGAVLGSATGLVRILDDETAVTKGRWSAPFNVGAAAVHAALLPTGSVLLFDRIGNQRVWNPTTLAVSRPSPPPGPANLFCSGHCYLPDGTLLVTGGHDDLGHGSGSAVGSGEHDGFGLATAFRFVASSQKWIALPKMKAGRWYPTNTVLANGDVLVVSGSVSRTQATGYVQNTLPEVWEVAGKRWRPLTKAQQEQVTGPFPKPQGVDLYPRMFLAPDGRVYKVGADIDTWYLNPAGTGHWTEGPRRLLELRGYGSAVMYEPGKILYVGGANPPTASAEVIDLNVPTPAWRQVGSMSELRRQLNATILPDGTVLATGGSRNPGRDADGVSDPVLSAELWNPATELWSPMDSMDIARLYHSTALLLPDGRVLSMGGGHSGDATSFHNEAEIFTPPYLFKGPRPTVTTAPTVLTYGQRFLIQTPDAAGITSACLLRLASVTHSFDQNTRRVPLTFTARDSALELAMPSAGTVAPPGHYLLFIVNGAGVPSVGRVVNLAMKLPGGAFRGLVRSTPAGNDAAGLVQFVVNSQNSFTATIVFGGKKQTVRGVFDATGDFAAIVPGVAPLSVQFSLDTATGDPVITGSLARGGATGAFTAERNFSPTHAAPPAGRYTVWLPHSADVAAPQGHGCGTLVVSAAGSARLVGSLGDGTAVSFGSSLPRSTAWPIYLSLYKSLGSISGELTFREIAGTSHVDGRLSWFRPGAFATEVELRGSHYTAPPKGTRVLNFPDVLHNGIFKIAAGNLTPPLADKTVGLETDNLVLIHGTESFTLKITLSNGLFSGKFTDPATRKLYSFKGAVIQEGNLGAGFFLGTGTAGSVELRPAP